MTLFDFFRGEQATPLASASSGAQMPIVKRFGGGKNITRSMGSATGTYSAADTGRLFSSWTTVPLNPHFLVEHNWQIVCARGREAARNKPHAKKFLRLCLIT